MRPHPRLRHRLPAAMAGCALATLSLAAAGAAQAQAATAPLAFTSHACEPQGASMVDCFAYATGGTGGYNWHWTDTTANFPDIFARCATDKTNYVTVTITDTAGAKISATMQFYCLGGPPR
jgi:hypothetical protein